MTIREYRLGDKEGVWKLFGQYPYMFDSQVMDLIKQDLEHKRSFWQFALVAEEKGKLLGYIFVHKLDDSRDFWKIEWVVVDKNIRRQRVGSKLFQKALDELNERKVKKLLVETAGGTHDTAKAARHFYRFHGMTLVGHVPDYWGKDEPKVIFCKEI